MSSPLALPATWGAVVGAYERVLAPVFSPFAARALALAAVDRGDRVLDVASGPGTLALLAAARRAEVSALDFAPEMVTRLRENARARHLDVDARVGDGEDLPWEAGTFDAAFSMFGLIFFPDPVRGLAELARVTRRRGRVVVGSWRPMDPRLAAVVEVLMKRLGAPPVPATPFGDEADIRARFQAAGLGDIGVHTASEHVDYPSDTALVDALVESNAVLVAVRASVGAAWAPIEAEMREVVRARWGEGPQRLAFDAWISVGTV